MHALWSSAVSCCIAHVSSQQTALGQGSRSAQDRSGRRQAGREGHRW